MGRAAKGHRPFVLPCLVATLLVARIGGAGELDALGVASLRGLVVDGQTTWLEGGFGRLTEGSGDTMATVRGQLHLGLDWKPTETWLVHAHGVAQGEPSSYGGQRLGLAEAFVQFRPEMSPKVALRFRAGLFFPATSLENSEPLWQSPYTITLSSLNAWIGEEIRLTGVEAGVVLRGARDRLELAGTVFAVNDPAGALLAWRGWTIGDRLSTLGEVLPLPPLPSLRPGGGFADQRDDGTRPIDELDSRLGYAARARWSRGDAIRLQGAFTDNRGDRRLYRGQYSWATRFAQAGLQARLGPDVTLVAEGAIGDTGMGPAVPGGPRVQLRFHVGYALLSWGRGRWRASARVDGFENDDRDFTAEPDSESGWAWTAAVFWKPLSFMRLGLEYVDVRSDRPAAPLSGALARTEGRRGVLEVRLLF